MNTTRTNPPPVFAVWWLAWLALLLLVFAVPSFFARLSHLAGNEARLQLLQGEKLSSSDLELVRSSRARAAAWFPENASYNDLALVAFEQAARDTGPRATSLYNEADLWQRKALTVSPADPYGWYRLAYLHYLGEGPSPQVLSAWSQSLASAPYEPRLVFPRLQMAMSLLPQLDDNGKLYLSRLIREAWRVDPYRFAIMAYEGSFVSIAEAALRDDEKNLAIFRERVAEAAAREK